MPDPLVDELLSFAGKHVERRHLAGAKGPGLRNSKSVDDRRGAKELAMHFVCGAGRLHFRFTVNLNLMMQSFLECQYLSFQVL